MVIHFSVWKINVSPAAPGYYIFSYVKKNININFYICNFPHLHVLATLP